MNFFFVYKQLTRQQPVSVAEMIDLKSKNKVASHMAYPDWRSG